MNKLITFALRAKSLVGGSLLMGVATLCHAQDVVNLGVVLPLTGPSATIGEDIRRGIALGVDYVNEHGGVQGKQLNAVIEDSGNNPTAAITAARKLVTVDNVVAVIGEYSSSITLPMAQYVVKEGVAHINIASSSVKVRDLGSSSFGIVGLDDNGNQFAAKDAYSLGYRNVAMIAPNNAYGQGIASGFKEEFEKLGGKVVGQVLYTGGQSSYRRELQQLSRSKPDAYVYTAYGQESAVINREASELGLRNTPWYADEMGMCISDTPPDIIEGQIGMDLGGSRGALGKAYDEKFKAQYKEGPKSVFNAYGYDGVLLVAAAINKAQSTTRSGVQEGLVAVAKEGFDGVTGSIKFDSAHQRIDPPYDTYSFKGGKLVPR